MKCVGEFHCGHTSFILKMEYGFANLICTDNYVSSMSGKKILCINTT